MGLEPPRACQCLRKLSKTGFSLAQAMGMIAKRVEPMKQLELGLNLSTRKTRKREFLEEIERVVPWAVLVQIVEPHYPRAKTGRSPSASRRCCGSTTCSSGSG
jgi:hypothetical protein